MPAKKTNRVRVARPTTLRGPRFGVAGSLLLHGGILAAALFVWNRSLDLTGEKSAIVPVDLVTITRKTDIAPMQVTPPPVIIPPPQEMPPPPVNLAAAPAAPEVKPPDIEVAPDAKPVKPPKQDVQQDLSDLLNDLTKPQKGRHGARSLQGAGSQSAMTADLADALTGQIYKCWNPPTGVPNAGRLVVHIQLVLNPDGTVQETPQSSADFNGPYTEAAIEAAKRAIHACAPYKLPAKRYPEWRQSVIDFDPGKLTE